MAFYWGLMTAILVLKVFSSAASGNITSTAAPTTAAPNNTTPTTNMINVSNNTSPNTVVSTGATNSGVPTAPPSQTTMITPTAAPTSSNDTSFIVSFKVNKECSPSIKGNLTKVIDELYKDRGFDCYGVVKYSNNTSGDKCLVNMTIKFGPKLKKTNIIEMFENLAKNSTLAGYEISDLVTNINVSGVTLGEFVPGKDECKNKCCGGAGGPITMVRTCTPEYKCRNYKLEKKEQDCTKVCPKECSGMTFKISLMLLLLGVLTNWLLK